MALTTIPTLTPSGYLSFSTPPVPPPDPTGAHVPYAPRANTLALPAGSSPDKAVITNIGPEPAYVLLTTAAATTTGTAASGSTAVTIADGTGIVVGQEVIGAGLAEGTTVAAISGTSLTLNQPTTAALSSTTLNFVVPVTPATGIVVLPWTPVSLAYGSNTFISAITPNGASRAILNVAVGV